MANQRVNSLFFLAPFVASKKMSEELCLTHSLTATLKKRKDKGSTKGHTFGTTRAILDTAAARASTQHTIDLCENDLRSAGLLCVPCICSCEKHGTVFIIQLTTSASTRRPLFSSTSSPHQNETKDGSTITTTAKGIHPHRTHTRPSKNREFFASPIGPVPARIPFASYEG